MSMICYANHRFSIQKIDRYIYNFYPLVRIYKIIKKDIEDKSL